MKQGEPPPSLSGRYRTPRLKNVSAPSPVMPLVHPRQFPLLRGVSPLQLGYQAVVVLVWPRLLRGVVYLGPGYVEMRSLESIDQTSIIPRTNSTAATAVELKVQRLFK